MIQRQMSPSSSVLHAVTCGIERLVLIVEITFRTFLRKASPSLFTSSAHKTAARSEKPPHRNPITPDHLELSSWVIRESKSQNSVAFEPVLVLRRVSANATFSARDIKMRNMLSSVTKHHQRYNNQTSNKAATSKKILVVQSLCSIGIPSDSNDATPAPTRGPLR